MLLAGLTYPIFCKEVGPPAWYHAFVGEAFLSEHLGEFEDMATEFRYFDEHGRVVWFVASEDDTWRAVIENLQPSAIDDMIGWLLEQYPSISRSQLNQMGSNRLAKLVNDAG